MKRLLLTASLVACAVSARAQLLTERFAYANGLITNEYAYHNPTSPDAKKSAVWELTSGSLFAGGGAGWTGVPDDKAVNAGSTAGTNSAVFRMNTVRKDFGNVAVTFRLLNQGLKAAPSVPAQQWDGVHVWLRYQSQYSLYYASINRRDNTAVIKKKVPGGPSNGGTYYNLSPSVPNPVPYNQWQTVRAEAVTNPNGTVTIRLFSSGRLVVQATDNGSMGGAPIRAPGGVGLRGDNANFKLDDFVVTAVGQTTTDSSAPVVSNVRASNGTAMWSTNEPSTSLVQWGRTTAYGSAAQNLTLKTAHALTMTSLTPGALYNYRVTSRNAAGKTTVSGNLTFVAPAPAQSVAFSGVGSTNRTTSSADIVWKTNVPADSQVEYGLTTSYGLKTPVQVTKVTSHRIRLSGLRAGTRYYYRVRSAGKTEPVTHALTTLSATTAAK